MTGHRRNPVFDEESFWVFLIPWLLVSILYFLLKLGPIAAGDFPDPDDAMRLLQVRDLLGGQSWFDVTQYRMNPPEGAPMHWSRLVDIPLILAIMPLKPILGQEGAELVARIGIPLLTLGFVMALVGVAARKLISSRGALFAIIMTPLSFGAVTQLMPLRIDHHGWQIALALVMLIALVDERRDRSAIVAGAAAACWFNISLEGLPLLVAAGAWFAIRWLIDASDGQRLKLYVLSVALTSVALFVATRAPGDWFDKACDSVSFGHLAAICGAAFSLVITHRQGVQPLWARVGSLVLCGLSAVLAMVMINAQCLADPFSALPPIVHQYWYSRVLEGLPIWKQSALMAGMVLGQPLVGLVGAFLGIYRSSGGARKAWIAYSVYLLAATVASILVLRAGGTASLIALPGTAILIDLAFRRARAIEKAGARVIATVGALCLLLPAYVIATALFPEKSAPADNGLTTVRGCLSKDEIKLLAQLPTGDIASPLDITPAILAYSPHRAIASGHHRNMDGIADVIRIYTLPLDRARTILDQRGIEYVVVCLPMGEITYYRRDSPAGLAAALTAGRPPAWLKPVHVPGVQSLKVWRLIARKD